MSILNHLLILTTRLQGLPVVIQCSDMSLGTFTSSSVSRAIRPQRFSVTSPGGHRAVGYNIHLFLKRYLERRSAFLLLQGEPQVPLMRMPLQSLRLPQGVSVWGCLSRGRSRKFPVISPLLRSSPRSVSLLQCITAACCLCDARILWFQPNLFVEKNA